MRFAGSVLGVGRAPFVVDRWSRNFRNNRRDVRNASWLLALIVAVAASAPFWLPYFTGWGLLFPGILTVAALYGAGDYSLRHRALATYWREFPVRYTTPTRHAPAGREDFSRFTHPLWWRWQYGRFIVAGGIVDSLVMLRVTQPTTRWCRRDRDHLETVLDDRTEQYWAAFADFDFMFRVWWMKLVMRAQMWGFPIFAAMIAQGLAVRGNDGLWLFWIGLCAPIALGLIYNATGTWASSRRRELAFARADD